MLCVCHDSWPGPGARPAALFLRQRLCRCNREELVCVPVFCHLETPSRLEAALASVTSHHQQFLILNETLTKAHGIRPPTLPPQGSGLVSCHHQHSVKRCLIWMHVVASEQASLVPFLLHGLSLRIHNRKLLPVLTPWASLSPLCSL